MAKGDLTITLNKGELAAVNIWLSEMSKVEASSTTSKALREGVRVIQAAGKTNLSMRNGVKTGNLKKSFSIKVVRRKGYGLAGFKRSAPKKGIKGGNHAHLVDRGTDERWTRKGAYRGSVSKGHPNTGSMFWTDAVESQGPRATEKLIEAVYKSLQEITQRNSK